MVRNIGKEKKEKEMREKSLVICKQEEENKNKDKEYKEMLEAITNTIKEVMKSNVVEEKKTAQRCFYCDKPRTCGKSMLS